MSRRWLITPLYLLLFYAALVVLSGNYAAHSFSQGLRQQLQLRLLPQLADAELYSVANEESHRYLAGRINDDLQALCPNEVRVLLADCRARVQAFNGELLVGQGYQPRPEKVLLLEDEQSRLQLGIYYRVLWWKLALLQALLLIPLVLYLWRMPRPLSRAQRQRQARLLGLGLSAGQARALDSQLAQLPQALRTSLEQWLEQKLLTPAVLSELLQAPALARLNPEQWPWLEQALRAGKSPEAALAIAQSPEGLQFLPQQRRVLLHGWSLELPGTPFFYYYWYALHRVRNAQDGWFINPPTNSSDNEHSEPLCELMERYGGHARAAKDLQEKGLRGKTLDQNRSKVKDELCRELGENLAEPYLFETERDPRTARYRYRVALKPEFIQVQGEDIRLLSEGNVRRLVPDVRRG